MSSRGEIHVLHVAADPRSAGATAEGLERAGDQFTVTTATGAAEGRDALDEGAFDCVVVEYDLADTTGVGLLHAVRDAHPALPVVLVGDDIETVAAEARTAGVTDFLRMGNDTVLAHRIESAVERVQRERALEAARDRYEMLFENNPIVIWEHDFSAAKVYVDELTAQTDDLQAYFDDKPDSLTEVFDRVRTIGVNRNAVEYYGANSKEHLLNNVDQVLGDEAWDLTKALWASIAAGETRFRGETVARTFDGERRHQVLDLYVPDAYADDYARVYMTGTDITALKRRERELERERDRLDEFASVVSHDLRNPLSVAQGNTRLARLDCESEYLDAASRAHDRMGALIDDLLTLARSGTRISEVEPVALADAAELCWETVETGTATLAVETDRTVRADRSRLQQLLENLVRNAVEHGSTSNRTPPGDGAEHTGGDVTVTVGSLDDGFYVEDDGPGIPADERDAVFDTGYSTTRDGTGFGLSIVQDIAEAHGWQVRLTESAAGGVRVEITGHALAVD